tara:strand:- start:1491 stop:1838 length:348 start_codon:yes stop_codon:yes gene_type:complete
MINGFYKETHELNEYEQNILLPVILRGLSTKTGESKAVTNKHIIESLKIKGYQKLTPARVRKIINNIRVNGLLKNLVASSKGYWIEPNIERRKLYSDSIIQRAEAMLAILKHIEI